MAGNDGSVVFVICVCDGMRFVGKEVVEHGCVAGGYGALLGDAVVSCDRSAADQLVRGWLKGI